MEKLTGLKTGTLKHIVYVDDDEEDRILFSDALKELDDTTTLKVFGNGFELINYLEKNKGQLPCSIVCDLQMPLINGIELLQVLKKDQRWQNIPVAVFSTSSASIDSVNAVRWGAVGFFSKPTTFNELKTTIAAILHRCSEAIATQNNKPVPIE
jgi:CheY-like chemotaxis protein